MKAESIVFAIGGMFFGLLVGWVVGDQQARHAEVPAVAATPAPAANPAETRQAPTLDESKAQALATVAQNDAKNATARVQLANLYFDAERYPDAIKWYEEALSLDSKNVDVSTDLGVSYYYSNQPDRALQQFDQSLKLDPSHVKTLLNQGIVLAFGKRDLDAAQQSWRKVIDLAPAGSPEATAAQRAIESLKAVHQGVAGAPGS